jgi:hypothetical protein
LTRVPWKPGNLTAVFNPAKERVDEKVREKVRGERVASTVDVLELLKRGQNSTGKTRATTGVDRVNVGSYKAEGGKEDEVRGRTRQVLTKPSGMLKGRPIGVEGDGG